MNKKVIYYSISAIFLLISLPFLFFDFGDRLFGPAGDFVEAGVRSLIGFLVVTTSLIFAFLAMVNKGKKEHIDSIQEENPLYHRINPLFLIIFGVAIFLIVRFDIGFNYFGAKTLLYLGSSILTLAGLANLLRDFLKK